MLDLKTVLIGQAAKENLKETIEIFSRERQPAGFALCDLSLEHFKEICSNNQSPLDEFKKRIELILHWISPSLWIPRYTMVSFSRTPYVLERTKRQDIHLQIIAWTALIVLLALPVLFISPNLTMTLYFCSNVTVLLTSWAWWIWTVGLDLIQEVSN
jgi:hypothetical protein